MENLNPHNQPLAAPGLTSYRYPTGHKSYVMIGSKNHEDALNEAARSLDYKPDADQLEIWDGSKYVKVGETQT